MIELKRKMCASLDNGGHTVVQGDLYLFALYSNIQIARILLFKNPLNET